MAKTESAEFLVFRKKLYKFYRNSVQNRNKDQDPEVAKLFEDLKSMSNKQEKNQFFDSFVTGLAKKKFAQAQLRKTYVEKVADYVRRGFKSKDAKFANLKAKIARMTSSEEKNEYLKKFVINQAEKEMAKNRERQSKF